MCFLSLTLRITSKPLLLNYLMTDGDFKNSTRFAHVKPMFSVLAKFTYNFTNSKSKSSRLLKNHISGFSFQVFLD